MFTPASVQIFRWKMRAGSEAVWSCILLLMIKDISSMNQTQDRCVWSDLSEIQFSRWQLKPTKHSKLNLAGILCKEVTRVDQAVKKWCSCLFLPGDDCCALLFAKLLPTFLHAADLKIAHFMSGRYLQTPWTRPFSDWNLFEGNMPVVWNTSQYSWWSKGRSISTAINSKSISKLVPFPGLTDIFMMIFIFN